MKQNERRHELRLATTTQQNARSPAQLANYMAPSIVVLYELYELYDWGKFQNFMEARNVTELYAFQNKLLILG